MKNTKVVVGLLIILLLAFVVVAEEIISNETITDLSNATLVVEETPIEILPVEETSVEITPLPTEESVPTPETPVVIQPIEETAPVEETPIETIPVENSSDELTGGLVIEPVVEPSVLTTVLELILDTVSVIRGQIIQLTAFLLYDDGTPAVDKEVNFYAGDEKIGSDITDDTGKATFSWNTSAFGPNVYAISAEYDGVSDGKNIAITEKMPKEMLTTAAVVNESTNESTEPVAMAAAESSPVEEIEECITIPFQEKENVYGTCTEERLECEKCENWFDETTIAQAKIMVCADMVIPNKLVSFSDQQYQIENSSVAIPAGGSVLHVVGSPIQAVSAEMQGVPYYGTGSAITLWFNDNNETNKDSFYIKNNSMFEAKVFVSALTSITPSGTAPPKN